MIFQPENNIGEGFRPVGLIFCGNLSFLLQVAYVTSLGYLCPKPASFEILFVCRRCPSRPTMGKTVAVPHFNHDTVEFASRERDKGSKHRFLFWKTLRKRAIVALDACYWLHKAISISLSRFGDDRRCGLSDFKRRFPASQEILCTLWFICIFFISEWKRSVVHTPEFAELKKKKKAISVYI